MTTEGFKTKEKRKKKKKIGACGKSAVYFIIFSYQNSLLLFLLGLASCMEFNI